MTWLSRHGHRLALSLLLTATSASAQEIHTLTVTRQGNDYRLDAELTVTRPRKEVFALLTDYERWPELTSTVRESQVLKSFGRHRHHVRSVSRACALIFCGTVMQVQLVVETPDSEVTARTLASQSNLRRGRVQWLLDAVDNATRVRLTMELTPAFWVPPLLGPWMVEHSLREQVLDLASALESKPLR